MIEKRIKISFFFMRHFYNTSLIILISIFTSILHGQNNDINSYQSDKSFKRTKKRFIHPQSKFIAISGGIGFTSTTVKSNNNFIDNGLLMLNNTYFPSIIYEHGLKNEFYLEIGYDYTGIGVSFQNTIKDAKNTSYTKISNNHNLLIGGLYRIRLKNGFQLFNFHSGLFIGLSNKLTLEIPSVEKSIYFDSSDNHYNSVEQSINHFNPFTMGMYFRLSKDIRLSQEVLLFIKCTSRIGFNSQFSGTFAIDSDFQNSELSTFKVRGNNILLSIGLKILINKKYLENEN